MSLVSGNGKAPVVDPGPDICPYTLGRPDIEPSSCIGNKCHLWMHFDVHRPEGTEVIEDCCLNLGARFSFQQMGTLMAIQAGAAQQRVQPINVHPNFRK